jgi:hypothetical protein
VQRSLQGFPGLVQLYRDYRVLCDDFFAQLALPKFTIRNEGDWATYYQEILTFLQLPAAPPEVLQNFFEGPVPLQNMVQRKRYLLPLSGLTTKSLSE